MGNCIFQDMLLHQFQIAEKGAAGLVAYNGLTSFIRYSPKSAKILQSLRSFARERVD